MCFSPQADVVGGLLIGVIGVDAVRHIRQRREFIALAWIPALLGAHQFIEVLVWLWLQRHVPRGIGYAALVSGYRNVVLFGGWAAVSSAAITLHCRFAKPPPQRARPGLAPGGR